MRRLPLLCCLVIVVVAGCGATPSPTPSPTATSQETTAPPAGTTVAKAPPNETGETTVVLDNQQDVAYVVDVTLVSEPFDGASVTYYNGTTRSFPDVSTARELRRAASLMRATDVNISGAASIRLEAEPGETVEATVEETPPDPVLIHLLFERDDPSGPSHWLGIYTCSDPSGFSPIQFILSADGGQTFDPECFYETPS